MFASAFLVPTMVCAVAFLINFIAIYYHASRAIPFGTMVSLSRSVESNKISNDRTVVNGFVNRCGNLGAEFIAQR